MASRRLRVTLSLTAFLVVGLSVALPAAGGAAKTEVQPADEQFDLILEHQRPGRSPDFLEGTHFLGLRVYPLRGVAVATTRATTTRSKIEK